MADYTVRVVAETKDADDKVKNLDRRLDDATRDRKIKIEIPSIDDAVRGVQSLGNALQTTYKYAKMVPYGPINDIEQLGDISLNAGKKVVDTFKTIASATPGKILSTSFTGAKAAADALAERTASLGYTIFGVTQSVNLLKTAFGAAFSDTVGREIRLQEALLRTKTTLVSTADVAVKGKRITDPYQAILKLEQPINTTVNNIRRRSLEIAGTTSDAIVQVFGVVASQIGNIGGNLKDAEDLAITFSAALGTLGLSDPVYATQEIRSILTGTIDQNSILARSLGLTNEEVAKAKNSAEGLVSFLQKRLAAFTAGQSLAAKGFAGITSNIEEFSQELKRAFGSGLLAPLLDGLSILYDKLQIVFKGLFGVAEAVGKTFGAIGRGVVGAAAAAPSLQGISQRKMIKGGDLLEQGAIQTFLKVQEAADKLRPQIALLSEQFIRMFASVFTGLKNLATGFAVFKFEQLKIYISSLTGILSLLNNSLIPALTTILTVYGDILKQPLAQYIGQLGVQFDVLDKVGVLPLTRTLFILARSIIPSVWGAFKTVGTVIDWLKIRIAGLIDYIVVGFSATIAALSNVIATAGTVLLAAVLGGTQAIIAGLRTVTMGIANFLINHALALQAVAPEYAKLATSILNVGLSLQKLGPAFDSAQMHVATFRTKTEAALDSIRVKSEQVRQSIANTGKKIKEGFDTAGGAVKQNIINMIKSMALFAAELFALQLAITIVVDGFGRWQREQQEIADQTRAELAVKRLSTLYAEIGDNASAATKAAKAFEEQVLSTRIDTVSKKTQDLNDALNRAIDIQADKGPGKTWRAFMAQLNIANWDVESVATNNKTNPNKNAYELFIERLIEARKRQFAEARKELERLSQFEEQLKTNAKNKEDVQILAKERRSMEKELNDVRKQLTKEIVDFEWSERQKTLQLEQQKREMQAELERQNLVRRQQLENQNLGDIGAGLKRLLDEYELGVFDAQVESQKKQYELATRREELEKQVADYRYKLEEQTLKLREKMGQMNQRIVDYEKEQRIRTAKEVLRYALQAAAVQTEDFIVTPEEKTNFLNAARQQGVSAERALTLLKLGAGQQLQINSSTPADIAISKLKEAFPRPLNKNQTSDAEFESLMNLRAKVYMNQASGGTYALRLSESELGTGRFKVTAPAPPPKMEELGNIVNISGLVNRERAALERNFVLSKQIIEQSLRNNSENLAKNFATAVSDPKFWGVQQTSGQLDESLMQHRDTIDQLNKALAQNAISYNGLDSIIQTATRASAIFSDVLVNNTQVNDPAKLRKDLNNAFSSIIKGASGDQAATTLQNLYDFSDAPAGFEKLKSLLLGFAQVVARVRNDIGPKNLLNDIAAQNEEQVKLKTTLKDQLDAYKLRNRYIAEGLSPERIDAELQINEMQRTFNALNEETTKILGIKKDRITEITRLLANPNLAEGERKKLQKELDDARAYIKQLENELAQYKGNINSNSKSLREQADLESDPIRTLMERWKRELKDIRSMIASLAQTIQSELATAMSSAVTGALDGTTTIGEAFGKMFNNIAKAFIDMAMQMIAKALVMKALGILFPGLFPAAAPVAAGEGGGGGSWNMFTNFHMANGGAFATNGIVPYATGGIISSPTLFRFAEGGAMRTGLMGEAGPEGILPLRRGSNGDLGVQAFGTGGGDINVTVNVDASGSKVEGETQQAAQLGRVISAAVQSELVKQKRPGGLLA